MPVPQPYVLERRLIIRRVSRFDRGFGGKLPLRDPVQPVGPPRQLNVMGNIGCLADQFVRFDDKAADVPAQALKGQVTYRSRNDRCDKPAYARHRHGVEGYDQSAENERHTDHEQAGERDVRVRVGHTGEDCMIGEQ